MRTFVAPKMVRWGSKLIMDNEHHDRGPGAGVQPPLWDWVAADQDRKPSAGKTPGLAGVEQPLFAPASGNGELPGRQPFRLFTDGAARGNPGPAGVAFFIEDRAGQALAAIRDYIGKATNNVAEYTALVRGLRRARELGIDRLDVYMDSELVVKQMAGQYRVRDAKLRVLHKEASELMKTFTRCDIWHIDRSQNARADALANEAIDEASKAAKNSPS